MSPWAPRSQCRGNSTVPRLCLQPRCCSCLSYCCSHFQQPRVFESPRGVLLCVCIKRKRVPRASQASQFPLRSRLLLFLFPLSAVLPLGLRLWSSPWTTVLRVGSDPPGGPPGTRGRRGCCCRRPEREEFPPPV